MSPSKRPSSDMDSSDEVPVKAEAGNKKARKLKLILEASVKWTPQEDAIFAEIAENLLKKGMWNAVKADKRLEHRKANGIYMRVEVMVKKMAKQ